MDAESISRLDHDTARALLEWQFEMGADEAICDDPIDRFAVASAPAPTRPPPSAQPSPAAAPAPGMPDAEAMARAEAQRAASLSELAEIQAAYELCELKKGARNFVFADGNPAARVMILGEAPGRDEDLAGLPFVGRAGQMLDRMFAAIGLSRQSPDAQSALYITNVMPWRPPQNRDPSPDEIAMMLPFVTRHVELADPDLIVLMGNTPCAAALGRKGILRLRGTWCEAFGRPALPMTHPAYLLRQPQAKREAWADLLALQARLRALSRGPT